MLNEIREYEEYVGKLTAAPRLMALVFTGDPGDNKVSGLGRALTIIARHELNVRGYFDKAAQDRQEVLAAVIQALKEWLGFAGTDVSRVTSYNSWLEKYYKGNIEVLSLSKKSYEGKIKPWRNEEGTGVCDIKKKQFEKSWFELLGENNGGNNFHKITYDTVIAEAIQLGPLQRYYLVCKDGIELGASNKLTIDGTKHKERIDALLKLVSAFLLNKGDGNSTANVVNMANLANWAQLNQINRGEYFFQKRRNCIFKYNKKVVITKTTIAGNVTKISFCEEFMRDFDFKLVKESDFEGVPDGYTFYSDLGSGKLLVKGKKY